MSPLAIRLAAFVAAVAMIVGAIGLRNHIDTNKAESATELRLLCTTELDSTCHAIADHAGAKITVTTEDAGATVDRLTKANRADVDGWLTPGPFPAMVDALRRGQPKLFAKVSAPIARSPVVLVGWNDRLVALKKTCEGGEVGWKCVGQRAGSPWSTAGGPATWGAVTTSLPDPTTSAVGLVTLGAAAADFFGRADLSTADLDDDAFSAWIAQLSTNNTAVDVSAMLAAGPSLVSFVGGLEATVKPAVEGASSDRRNSVSVIYPAPVGNADVVLGMVGGRRGERLLAALQAGAAQQAWRAAGFRAPASTPSGLPPADLLAVLRERWAS